MQFGLNVINPYSAGFYLTLAKAAEEVGWDSFFVWDHLIFPWEANLVDAWTVLSAIGGGSKKLKLSALVTPLPGRSPVKVARETATLDEIIGGQVVLGAGLGGDPSEQQALGEETDPKIRAEMLDESLNLVSIYGPVKK